MIIIPKYNVLAISWVKTRRSQANFALYNSLSALPLSVRSLLLSKWIQQEEDRCSLLTTSELRFSNASAKSSYTDVLSNLLPPQNSFSSPSNWLHSQPASCLWICSLCEMSLGTQRKPQTTANQCLYEKPMTKPLQAAEIQMCFVSSASLQQSPIASHGVPSRWHTVSTAWLIGTLVRFHAAMQLPIWCRHVYLTV